MPPVAVPPPDATLVHALRAVLELRTGAPVELLETHLSWVLLTRKLALKLKKPLRLAFVDYSSVELRRHCCLDEVRLNRRFAPALYRAVVAVRGTPAKPRLGGDGAPIDHLVCMRRFPADALLSDRLAAGRLDAVALERFGQRLSQLQDAAPLPAATLPLGWPEQVLQTMLQVMDQLRARGCDDRAGPLRGWVDDQAWTLWDLWRSRREGGFVRECHGDLHLGNLVMLGDRVSAFDCIEFDPALRWIDVISDVAFPVMDLEARGRRDLAFRFLDGWLQSSGDYAGLRGLRFHVVYRALVRALVGAMGPRTTAPDYLACAARWTSAPAPRLLITHGLSGSGKSSAALRLLEMAGAVRVRSDVERKRLGGAGPQETPGARYDPATTRRTYGQLAEAAEAALRGGFPVIVDAAFLRAADRRVFRELAAALDVPFNILCCSADDAVLRLRIADRARVGEDASEADTTVLDRQIADIEVLSGAERNAALFLSDPCTDLVGVAAAWAASPRPRAGAPACQAHAPPPGREDFDSRLAP